MTDQLQQAAQQAQLVLQEHIRNNYELVPQELIDAEFALRAAIEQAINTCGSGAGCLYKDARIEALEQALHTEEAISFRKQLNEVQAENTRLRRVLFNIAGWDDNSDLASPEEMARAAITQAGEVK